MTDDPRTIALTYIDACGRKDLDAVAPLLAPDMIFAGPRGPVAGAAPYLAVLRRLAPVWVRSDVHKVFTDGPDVCVVYDLVTDTAAGAVPIVEWLRVDEGRITRVTLIFDRVAFEPASQEIARRARA